MGHTIKKSRTRHVNEIKQELIMSQGLPFSEILSEDTIRNFFEEHCQSFRQRIFTPARTLWILLSQVMDVDKSCQGAVIRLIGFLAQKGEKICSSNTAAYCKARLRLPVNLLSGLAKHIGIRLEVDSPKEWLWHGRHVKLVDGTTLALADTEANKEIYPQSNNDSHGTIGYLPS